MGFWYLLLAVVSEVIATSALKASAEFSRFWPSVVVVVGYTLSFYLLTLVFRTVPVGVTYAVWSGLGIVLITLAGIVLFKEIPDLPAIIGMTLIIGGVGVINLFSKTGVH
ncbi:DMT family transporter [Aestuariirhabdus litorea]|uniref:QacE family quaternary ammonium compound efflux SMR transporter n=1 Tax=Aestuariirhabdus litorea TaxID=2528527 RepID=A0A3P3VKH3_9GAMM|nr:multidrug efflux SMR transporter [Aestuariirhabdus litorea]RRJ83232.1 QacE family quaternary ammonium compound efflux SMR transporter [Aestuariirhabdus litorea]RWW93389.1 multidrug efflux SMR transporter [Endozoicomonadaceae bacterium GTF-13]